MNSIHINSPEKHIAGKGIGAPADMQVPDCAKAIAFGAVRDELIRQTAYSFYKARNFFGGHAVQDWLRAEAMVNQMPGKISLAGRLA